MKFHFSATLIHAAMASFVIGSPVVLAKDTPQPIPSAEEVERNAEDLDRLQKVMQGPHTNVEFQKALTAAMPHFPKLRGGSKPGKPLWTKCELNVGQQGYDGLRFRTPKGEAALNLYWLLSTPQASDLQWNFYTTSGEAIDGRRSYTMLDLPLEDVELPARNFTRIQAVTRGQLEPDTEYFLWLEFGVNKRQTASVGLVFLPDKSIPAQMDHPESEAAEALDLRPTNIFGAIALGRLEHAKELCKDDPTWLNEVNNSGESVLAFAAVTGQSAVMNWLIEKGQSVEGPPRQLYSPLMSAIHAGNIDAMELLLGKGAGVNKPVLGRTPLHIAAKEGRGDAARCLLKHKGDASALDDEKGATPLHWALEFGNPDLMPILVEGGADVNAVTKKDGATPIALAARVGDLETIDWLLAHDAKINPPAPAFPPLFAAASPKNTETFEALLKRGADPKATTKPGWTLLHSMAQWGNLKGAERLLESGADINVFAKGLPQNPTPLHVASKFGNSEMVDWLLAHGATIQNNADGSSGLIHDAKSDDIVKLLKAGADINMRNENGDTPLHYHIRHDSYRMVNWLLGKGADPNVKSKAGQTPLEFAEERKAVQSIKVLTAAAEKAKKTTSVGPSQPLPNVLIINARWGEGKSWTDTTNLVQSAVQAGVSVSASVEFLKSDPSPKKHKHLEISYEIDGLQSSFNLDEGKFWTRNDVLKQK